MGCHILDTGPRNAAPLVWADLGRREPWRGLVSWQRWEEVGLGVEGNTAVLGLGWAACPSGIPGLAEPV